VLRHERNLLGDAWDFETSGWASTPGPSYSKPEGHSGKSTLKDFYQEDATPCISSCESVTKKTKVSSMRHSKLKQTKIAFTPCPQAK
jgi:hypothetical protein